LNAAVATPLRAWLLLTSHKREEHVVFVSVLLPASQQLILLPLPPSLFPTVCATGRSWKLEHCEMRSNRRRLGGRGGGWGGQGGGVSVAASFAALLGCVVALVGGAAGQGPRPPSDYKTLSGMVMHPSLPAFPMRVESSFTPLLIAAHASA
jgi:hypothetical protein